MERELTYAQKVEQSINRKFRKKLWNPFIAAIKEYSLIEENDKIAVCISGGKDSMCMAKLMQLVHRYTDIPFDLEFLVMDPGYNALNRAKIEENARKLEVPVKIFETDIFDIANTSGGSPCYLCARMRRGHLYAEAKKLGCNKIALGHHANDVIETTLLGMFYGSQLQGMMPKLKSTNFEGMELIRPMYKIYEEDVIAWSKYNELDFIRCACRFTENTAFGYGESKRLEIKNLIKELKKTNPGIEDSIMNSINDVCIDTFPYLKTDGVKHSFLETYNKKEEKGEN